MTLPRKIFFMLKTEELFMILQGEIAYNCCTYLWLFVGKLFFNWKPRSYVWLYQQKLPTSVVPIHDSYLQKYLVLWKLRSYSWLYSKITYKCCTYSWLLFEKKAVCILKIDGPMYDSSLNDIYIMKTDEVFMTLPGETALDWRLSL